MGRKPFHTPDEKLAIVLSVLKGETTRGRRAAPAQPARTAVLTPAEALPNRDAFNCTVISYSSAVLPV